MNINKPQTLIIHHTGGTDADPKADTSHHTFEIVNAYHKSLGWGGIGYHYFIDRTGKVTQGRKDTEEGAHTIGQNKNSLGICLAGNFDVTMPTESQKIALKSVLKAKMAEYSIPNALIVPHRHFASKSCYGSKLSDTWARDLVQEGDAKPIEVTANDVVIDRIRKGIQEIDALLAQIR